MSEIQLLEEKVREKANDLQDEEELFNGNLENLELIKNALFFSYFQTHPITFWMPSCLT